MTRRIGLLGLVLAGLVGAACENGGDITNPADCPETRSVRIVLENADGQSVAQLSEGEFARLDITALDAQRNPQSAICNGAATARWDITPAGVVSLLGDRSGFTLLAHADAPGVATIQGCVDAICATFGVRVLAD
jgi:hypothetical protein